jgi:uncharacterized protein (TIGR02996 family)
VDTAAAILADVLENPTDDVPRLVYADWLDDHGDPARAEFVRVQVEVAGLSECHVTTVDDGDGDPGGRPCRCPWHALRRRELDLLTPSHFWRWFGPVTKPGWPGTPVVTISEKTLACEVGYYIEPGSQPHWVLTPRRGFVEEVTLPLAAWREHGRTLVAVCPLVRVGLTDREPRDALRPNEWWWWEEDEAHPVPPIRCDLPTALWELLPGDRTPGWRGIRYDSRAAAVDALSVACLAFARRPSDDPVLSHATEQENQDGNDHLPGY